MAHHLARDVRGLVYRSYLPRADPRVPTTSRQGIRCVHREEGEITLQIPLPFYSRSRWRRQILALVVELELDVRSTPTTTISEPTRYKNNHTKPTCRSLSASPVKRCRNNPPNTHRATDPRAAAHAAVCRGVFHHVACDVLQRVHYHLYIHWRVSGGVYLFVGAVGTCGE